MFLYILIGAPIVPLKTLLTRFMYGCYFIAAFLDKRRIYLCHSILAIKIVHQFHDLHWYLASYHTSNTENTQKLQTSAKAMGSLTLCGRYPYKTSWIQLMIHITNKI